MTELKKRHLLGVALAAYLCFFVVLVVTAKATPHYHWHRSHVTTYSVNEPGSSHTAQGCVERGLRNKDRTFAARDYQVPCGGKAIFCYKHRCVVARRTDTAGGGVAANSLDLNYGLAKALHLPKGATVSPDGTYPGGYTWVSWRRT